MKKEDKRKVLRRIEILLFAIYLAIMCYFLFFAERLGRTYSGRTYHYNLVPLKEIRRFWEYRYTLDFWAVMLNLAGNVVAFIPFGVFLPSLFAKCRKVLPTVLLSFECSLTVEIIQLVGKVGSFDVDDILLNTLGGLLGYIVYLSGNYIWRKWNEKKKK